MVSLLDVVPTVLDWFNIKYPQYTMFHKKVTLTGRSLLPLTHSSVDNSSFDITYASQSLHEITMYYPMRVVRTPSYKLIQNVNYLMPFPIDQDFYMSPTFKDMINRTASGVAIPWYKTLNSYYYRPQWELYDLTSDSMELRNLYHETRYSKVVSDLKKKLNIWQATTADPWICAPTGVLENGECLPLYNDIPNV